ncbi:MAG: 1-deoxy-D-xylulose-5-phosphate reductoisomerase [Phycisphaerae bacterium]|jgi:1-deoxy-D-xylulose-5-phosphate reductoisomerase|nr:1-deoxy-D-xylulose-5-phosphate reductoisomerase [Phycisphaerae bacterium]MCZ2400950.1 1-deoxy-D-xylulose-5-phosphate reductoisomerase [Phycisphaerae bacterium]
MERRIVILGSTGSIGRAALEVVEGLGPGARIVGLTARDNGQLLAEQVRRTGAPLAAIADERGYDALRRACPGTRVMAGPEGLVELVRSADADFVLAAIVGAAGLAATLAAVERGLAVGVANKESLVVAGAILMPLARQRGATIIPVDSEHSAVFQCLSAGRLSEVRKIYLTASGGPFRTWSAAQMAEVTPADALRHPTWSMGPKITIDSATMMNKALEVIEARHLFGLAAEQIDVLVHPQSIVHSMVEYCDGSIIAQMGTPDMKTPIQYAMTYPQRGAAGGAALDWKAVRALEFEPPDPERFPALRLGYEAARLGGSSGAVLNAANERAVDLFRERRIGFLDIARLSERVLSRHRCIAEPTLEQLLESDRWARMEVDACC